MSYHPTTQTGRRQFRMSATQRTLKVELPWVADYVIVTNPNNVRLYMHSGSAEYPTKTSYDFLFPGLSKSQDGVESNVFGFTLGEPTDLDAAITETTVIVFVKGESASVMGSMPIAPLSTVSIAPGSSVGITGTPNVAVPGGVGITNSPAVSVPGGVGITGTANVAVPGGVGINGTPNVALPGGAVVSGTVTTQQASGVFQGYVVGAFGASYPTQTNFGWFDLLNWGGALCQMVNTTTNVDMKLDWYVSPNGGGTAYVAKTWIVKPGQTFTIRVPKMERYVLFAVTPVSGFLSWDGGVRATQETIFEPSIQTIGTAQDYVSYRIPNTTVVANTWTNAGTLPSGYEIIGGQLSHSGTAAVLQMGIGAGITPVSSLYVGNVDGTIGSSPWLVLGHGESGGFLIVSGVNNTLLVQSTLADTIYGTLHLRRRILN